MSNVVERSIRSGVVAKAEAVSTPPPLSLSRGIRLRSGCQASLSAALRQYGMMSKHGALALLTSQGALCIEIEYEDERMYDEEEATPKHNLGHTHEPWEWEGTAHCAAAQLIDVALLVFCE